MNLNIEDLERYSRNILLPEIGGNGQGKLLKAKVLVIGAGGLGSPLIMYLAACGVGNITIIDYELRILSRKPDSKSLKSVGEIDRLVS